MQIPRCPLLIYLCALSALAAGCSGRAGASAQPEAANSKSETTAATPASAPTSPAAPSGAVRDVTFDTIKLDLAKDQPFDRKLLTAGVLGLDGRRIRIRGYILPSFQQSGLAQFVLVRDNMECCFGPGAALHDCIVVEMTAGRTTDFTTRPVAVEGKFTVHEVRGPDDKCLAIYHLSGEKVQ